MGINNTTLVRTLNNPFPESLDGFGTSVSISSSYLLIGAPNDDNLGVRNVGSAYLYDLEGNLIRSLDNPTPENNDNFGTSVSVTNSYLAIGTPGDKSAPQGGDNGAVYLYNTNGELLQTIIKENSANQQFGNSVSIDDGENYLIIGASEDNNGAANTGAAYLYDVSGNLLQSIFNPTPEINDLFATSVDIDSNYFIIGTPNDNTGAPSAGSAYLYDINGNLLQTINNPTPEEADTFGASVSINGEYILIGAPGDNTTDFESVGSAYLYDINGNLLQTISHPNPGRRGEAFGNSVSIDGNNLLIGATGKNRTGAAYLFDLNGNLLQTVDNPFPDNNDDFGSPVDIKGTNFVVASINDDTNADNTGSAYLYQTGQNSPLNIPLNRFQNSALPGTYVFANETESQNIRDNFSPPFVEEGTAFCVANIQGDNLIQFNRFQNSLVPGTYLYATEAESITIRNNFSNFVEEGIAFYAYDGNANLGVDYYRFQNTQQPGTYIFVGASERQQILDNFPQFVEEGVAFEAAPVIL